MYKLIEKEPALYMGQLQGRGYKKTKQLKELAEAIGVDADMISDRDLNFAGAELIEGFDGKDFGSYAEKGNSVLELEFRDGREIWIKIARYN